ncbi:SrfA family protein [Stutzerimonas kunmingensis]|uniref:SrfA family protein n=1 Tax=Stutzerimonas kunmingensis TaxID=1211807 RepID=UPI00241C1CBB|nr:SrfA family protein [Stutzerimonas kunmingensis]
MRGALLRSGKSETFTALGETGQPVYRAALQLREAIRRKDAGLVEHLAIPQSDELGSQIDWYSDIPGDVIPWTSATEEERAPARRQLERLRTALDDLSARFLGSDTADQQGDKAVFGKLLKRVIYFPDESFVYLVNGKPVLAFWGFQHADADRSLEPLHCLYPRSEPEPTAPLIPPAATVAAPLATEVEPAPVVARPWWRRWWWLWPLLLLLLALLLLSLLRGCMPTAGLPGMPQLGLPTLFAPELPTVSLPADGLGLNGSGIGTGGGRGAPGMPELQGSGDSPEGEPAGPGDKPESSKAPADEPPTPPALEAEPEAEPAQPADEPQPEPSQPSEQPQPPQLPQDPQEPLSIPEQAGNGPADFLNGDWRAGAGIQDRRTGKPLRLQYRFDDGKGEVTVRRPDGVDCSGPVTAAMNNGSLAIDSHGQAACADGSNYDMPQVTCAKGAQSIADCTGSYGNERFPMSMRRAGE